MLYVFFFFQAEDGIRDLTVTGVQTCALPIWVCGQGEHAIGEPAGVAVSDEISRDAVANRFAQPRTVRCERGSTASGGFDVRDAPPFFWTRENHRPGLA